MVNAYGRVLLGLAGRAGLGLMCGLHNLHLCVLINAHMAAPTAMQASAGQTTLKCHTGLGASHGQFVFANSGPVII